ncbi:Glycosyl hydrolases family 31 protein [Prunus dulcis]|uniref:Glycosyl hydrolases family 31 protein n=1 Tax=Prunus dulcis TaxID=3755 RepID=A0A5H2Y504_PRUDU|nr:Glycosyl hydrolases family 31 protein [Prunus dulcis]
MVPFVSTTHPMVTRGKVEPLAQDHAVEDIARQQAKTWTLVPHTPSMNVLPNKWVYHIKRKSDGTIERYKARLVARITVPYHLSPTGVGLLYSII